MIVIDVESTGIDPRIHSLVSIGALDFDRPDHRFYSECRMWDGAHVMDDALAVNGFTRESITDPDKQSEADLVRSFLAWTEGVEDRTLAGQNVSFDRDFLFAATVRATHTPWPLAQRTIDTHTLAWMHMVKRGIVPPVSDHHSALNLDALLAYCGLPAESKPHHAYRGAQCHAEVIARLVYGRKLLPDFAEYAIPFS